MTLISKRKCPVLEFPTSDRTFIIVGFPNTLIYETKKANEEPLNICERVVKYAA